MYLRISGGNEKSGQRELRRRRCCLIWNSSDWTDLHKLFTVLSILSSSLARVPSGELDLLWTAVVPLACQPAILQPRLNTITGHKFAVEWSARVLSSVSDELMYPRREATESLLYNVLLRWVCVGSTDAIWKIRAQLLRISRVVRAFFLGRILWIASFVRWSPGK
jgi:hypothetical protein